MKSFHHLSLVLLALSPCFITACGPRAPEDFHIAPEVQLSGLDFTVPKEALHRER